MGELGVLPEPVLHGKQDLTLFIKELLPMAGLVAFSRTSQVPWLLLGTFQVLVVVSRGNRTHSLPFAGRAA